MQPVDQPWPPGHRPLAGQANRHPGLAPLLDLATMEPGHVRSSLGVCCTQAGRIVLADDLADRPDGAAALRYGLELAWLVGLPGLSRAASAVLAGRAAGCFACLPGVLGADGRPHPVFASLAAPRMEPALAAAAARVLVDTHDGPDGLTAHDLACIEALWPIVVPTECLLASGGDDRLTLDPATGLNRYGCTPWPRPAMIAFGSCTASSLSPGAFAAAEMARRSLAADMLETTAPTALAAASDAVVAALLDHFDVADLADAVLAASGTDAALVVTGLLAAERPNEALTSILMSPSETGSGVPDAVQGRHFATSAAAGCKVGKGQPIEGMALVPHLATVALRHGSGAPRAAAAVAADCERAIREGVARGRVVLHAIDGSKTGLTAPDRASCRRLADTYGGALDIVVDACQARIEPALARWYLQQGFPVLVTGSKFFASPGFCGAVLFPRARLARIAGDGRLPTGLAPYARLEGGFGSRRCPGLVLRWRAALHEMAAFATLPVQEVRRRLEAVGRTVRGTLWQDQRVSLVDAPRPRGYGWSGRRSVFTFRVRQASGRWMTPGELRVLYESLGSDLSGQVEAPLRLAASRLCQLGQPVEIGSSAVGGLRIAISAAQVVQGGDHATSLAQVMEKLGLLLDRSFARGAIQPAASRPAAAARPALATN